MPAVTSCKIWHRDTTGKGYGRLRWSQAGQDKNGSVKKVYAHRLAYKLLTGNFPVNEGAHLCGNRACVNPGHVCDKTGMENALDMRAHGTARYDQRLSPLPYVYWAWLKHGGGYWLGAARVNGRNFQAFASVSKHGDIGAQRVAFERLVQKLTGNGFTDHAVVRMYRDGSYVEILNAVPAFELAA